MLWFGKKKKREEELLAALMRGAAEGASMSRLKSSLATVGVDISKDRESKHIAIEGSLAVVGALTAKSEVSASPEDSVFVDGVMLMVLSNHISHVLRCSFETVSTVALASHFGPAGVSEISQVIDSYNEMSMNNSNVIQAVGNASVKWCEEPSEQNLTSLAALRDVLLKSASEQ